MVVGFTTTCAISAYHHYSCEFEPHSWRSVLDTMICDKACQFPPLIKLTPRYSWNSVESGVKHHKPPDGGMLLEENTIHDNCKAEFFYIGCSEYLIKTIPSKLSATDDPDNRYL